MRRELARIMKPDEIVRGRLATGLVIALAVVFTGASLRGNVISDLCLPSATEAAASSLLDQPNRIRLSLVPGDLVAQWQKWASDAEAAWRLKFFEAIGSADKQTFIAMLNSGMDPNAEFPDPPPKDFVKRFKDDTLHYYLSSERGFTALMFATCLQNEEFVRFLLQAGADPFKTTHRHKTFALWLAAKTQNIEIMRCLMRIGPSHESRLFHISVNLATQTAVLWKGQHPEITMPISSGRSSHPTPPGRYLVTNKYRTWRSTLYPAAMPYFLRLSCGDFGLHEGVLPGFPASHGCIRLPGDSAKQLFASVPIGTLVEIR